MIYSMTAFARKEVKGEWGTAIWEIRSVNQRFLETYFRLPESFREVEPVLREHARQSLQRGKVEASLKFQSADKSAADFTVNAELLQKLVEAVDTVNTAFAGTQPVNPLNALQWPGIVQLPEQDMSDIQQAVVAAFKETVQELLQARQREGAALAAIILDRVEKISVEVTKVREQMPQIIQWQRDKLRTRFEEAQIACDETRFEQELVMLAQRLDVAEEMDRLDTHVTEVKRVLKQGGAIGRRLDFLMQELNREANTTSSKSVNTDVTACAVEMKVLIEQMREQIQNIE